MRPDRGDRQRQDPGPRHPRRAAAPRRRSPGAGGRGVRGRRRPTRRHPPTARRTGGQPESRGSAQVLSVQSDATVWSCRPGCSTLDGVRLGRVTARQPTLEDAYVAIVNRASGVRPDGARPGSARPGSARSDAPDQTPPGRRRRCRREDPANDRGRRVAARQAAEPVLVGDRIALIVPVVQATLALPRSGPAANRTRCCRRRRGRADGGLVVGAVRFRRRDPEPALAGHPGDDHAGAPAAGAGGAADHRRPPPSPARTPWSPRWPGAGLLYGIPLDFADPVAFAVAVPACIIALGMFGLLLARTFVLLRNANALTNTLEYPIWLVSGMLVPITVLPGLDRPDRRRAAHHLGGAGRSARRPPAAARSGPRSASAWQSASAAWRSARS